MDEDCVHTSMQPLVNFFLFSSLIELLLREDGRQHRAPSSIYRRGCMPHHHFHLQFLYILRLGKLTRRGRQKVPMKIAHAHYKPYKTILFYEAPAAHVELTPSKLNSGGVESRSRSKSSSFLQSVLLTRKNLGVRGNLWRFWSASAVNTKPSRPVGYLSTGVYPHDHFFHLLPWPMTSLTKYCSILSSERQAEVPMNNCAYQLNQYTVIGILLWLTHCEEIRQTLHPCVILNDSLWMSAYDIGII